MHILQKLKNLKRTWTTKDSLIVTAGLAVFGALSFGNMSRWSIWFDEAFGVYLIRHSFADVAKFTATDVHPPLYYWLLKLWQGAFGDSELALRSMSMLFIMIAMVFVYLIVRRAFSRNAAAWVMAFMAISPMMIRYADEARMYGLAMAIVAAASYVLIDATNKPSTKKWIVYGVLVSLGMWTHYFTALIWIAHWVWRYLAVRTGNAKQTSKAFWSKEWVRAHIVAVGLFLPWLPTMVVQMSNVQGGGFWIQPITVSTPFNFITNVVLYRENDETLSWLGLLMLAVIIVSFALVIRTYLTLKAEQKQLYRLFIAMVLVPMAVLIIASMPPLRPSFIDRYLVTTLPYWAALIGIAVYVGLNNKRTKLLAQVTAGLVAVAMIFGIVHVYEIGNFNKHSLDPLPVRQTAQAISNETAGTQPIVVLSSWRFYELHYYDSAKNPVYFEATDNLVWGSYDMLRENDYRKVRDTAQFARENGGKIWFAGDWTYGKPVMPRQGEWTVLREIKLPGIGDKQSTIRAVELQLK